MYFDIEVSGVEGTIRILKWNFVNYEYHYKETASSSLSFLVTLMAGVLNLNKQS
jgi:hypothetical protein